MQKYCYGIGTLKEELLSLKAKKFFLVCDNSFSLLNIKDAIENCGIPFVKFDGFQSNPLHDDVDKGCAIFENEDLSVIVAVGGGSSMDVAKCIKLDSKKSATIIAIPTTAGTGSESTKHIVVYRDGKKESLGNELVIPEIVIFEPKVLASLPDFQKKCTMLDALCQGIESFWSINSTPESKIYSEKAIRLIMENKDDYINHNSYKAACKIMEGANFSGKAINITQTTAAHAMSYKITSKYGIPHGGAVAICLPVLWDYMCNHVVNCIDLRGDNYLSEIFMRISFAMGVCAPSEAIGLFRNMLEEYKMPYPVVKNYFAELDELTDSVNLARLKNNPVSLSRNELLFLYEGIIKK